MSHLISINIVTHNRADFLVQAVNSVLRQSCDKWELIVVDDASSDDTPQKILPFLSDKRIKYYPISKQNSISAVRNIALAKSGGEYLAVLDSDDVWLDKDKLSKQLKYLEINTNVIMVGSGAKLIDKFGQERRIEYKPSLNEQIKKDFFIKNPFFHSSVMCRLEAVKKNGGYNENIKFGEDLDLWLRLGREGEFYNFPDILIEYRIYQDNEISKHYLRSIWEVLKVMSLNRKYYGIGYLVYFKKIKNKFFEYFHFFKNK